MRKIVSTNPENTRNYLTPKDKKQLLITIGLKLVLALVGAVFLQPKGDYTGLETFLLLLLMFALVYDVGCLYQVCLHIAQSIFFSFLLFLIMLLGCVFLIEYGASFLAAIDPSTATGQNLSLIIMAVLFLIPFVIDVVRLIRLMSRPKI